MSFNQNIIGANNNNLLNDSWEKQFWASELSPERNVSNTSENVSDTPIIQVISGQNYTTTTLQDYRTQTCTSCHKSESSSSFSPTWEDSALGISQNFNPSPPVCSTFNAANHSDGDRSKLKNAGLRWKRDYFKCFTPASSIFKQQITLMGITPNLRMQNSSENGKLHHARINFVRPEDSAYKAIVKRKRKRTVFTTEQFEVLEAVFSKKPYVTRDERQVLVQQLQVNDKSIKVWFQNRRLKNRRGDDQYEVKQHDGRSTKVDRLNTLEFQIGERTDEFGYVTLDDDIMSELVNVVHDFFASNVSQVQTKSESVKCPIYEPISPATNNNNSTQNFLDFESLLLT